MKKKMRVLSALLALSMGVSVLAACGNSNKNNDETDNKNPPAVKPDPDKPDPDKPDPDPEPDPGQTDDEGNLTYDDADAYGDPEIHLVDSSKLLHRRTVTEADRPFVTDGSTQYKIVVGTSQNEATTAANFIISQLSVATGAAITIINDVNGDLKVDGTEPEESIEWSETAKYIVYSHGALEQAAGITWDEDAELGYSGYMIKSVGDSVFIKVNGYYGYQTATLCFLREVLGYEWYSEDLTVYTKDGATLPTMDIVERPDFDFIDRSYINGLNKYPTGQTADTIFVAPNGNFVHNSFDYLPPATHLATHPKWYSDPSNPVQLCYAAHGDKAEYEAMVDAALNSVLYWLDKYATASTVTFTHQDNSTMCKCNYCRAAEYQYGTITSTVMMFINDLDDALQAELQRRAEANNTAKREITVLFFAYLGTEAAPVSGTDKSNYEVAKNPDNVVTYNGTSYNLPYRKTYPDGFKCNEHVGLFYAPIRANFTKSFYEEENKMYADTLEKWGLLTERVYAWIYDTNFYHYILPYNSFDSIAETMRFLKSNNCTYVFNQAQGTNTSVGATNSRITGFGALKTYLNMTLPRDVNRDEGVLVNKFFENYFGPAANVMREYYDSLTMHMRKLEREESSVFNGAVNPSTGPIEDAEYWPLALMQNWLDLCDRALAAISVVQAQNPDLYEVLQNHILVETLFPQFMICEYYSGYYTHSQITEMRQDFFNKCNLLGVQAYSENTPLKNNIFNKWGVS